MSERFTPAVRAALRKGERLEWITLAWLATAIPLMALTAGASQAMKTAWIEDMLSVVPPIVYLVSVRMERKAATRDYPHGFDRVNSLAFLIASVALSSMGVFLLYESITALLKAEHPTIGTMTLFGQHFWAGWAMITALLYSTVPAVILGRLKHPLAVEAHDAVLSTDALMQKADWMTGLAAMAGVLGIGFGLWWMDALAAALISLDILRDGFGQLKSATAELLDGAPRKLDKDQIDDEARILEGTLKGHFPGREIRLRETGRVIHAQVLGDPPAAPPSLDAIWPGAPERAWRFETLSFVPVGEDRAGG